MKTFLSLFVLYLQIFLLILSGSLKASDIKISYTVSMPFPSNHLFEVSILVENYSSPETYIDFTLPSWRSGRYAVLNFSSGVQEFSAESTAGKKYKWTKTDKDTWRVHTNSGSVCKITYRVFSNEFSIRTRGLNDEQGFIDASAVLMFAEKLRYNPLQLRIIPFDGWNVTTGLDRVSGTENTFYARDYYYLADCPLLMGNQKSYEFFINEKKFTVVFQGMRITILRQ